ncbi:hypothetical protein SKTS_11520 [Sulfurimicrobium lacus]|uniref:Protein-glutamine gamma-glutamyltransferase-like C-terminal domain-containing protein n=1 Tax=Sulfurimicrobium lacus TaxID=2715678 RepID=A0A6F8VB83_9PROT|nr:DUF4129 domain-containing protein [Sulfurimicrobium lacus]BCB26266.1 hypothetical protein SKTS_11520 [Sulfurimicrobium lacus]
MSPPLTYFPAYLGLFAAQVLALTCNAFLDIQYGGFGTEVLIWTLAFGFTLRIGWRQQGQLEESGRKAQKTALIGGLLLSVFLFIPMWGFPRAGLYMLAALQAAYNCVLVSRRQLHMSLVIAVVMVMFAASHYRADWTLLFYLVPFVTAVVFTLVAEQINRRTLALREQSLGQGVAGGQGVAIAAATATILLIGALLYAVTPQATWETLQWRYGQAAPVGPGGHLVQMGQGGSGDGMGSGGTGPAGSGLGGSGMGSGWPSPGDMRKAASRAGMPHWQAGAINAIADLSEQVGKIMAPVMKKLADLWDALKKWLKAHQDAVLAGLVALALLAILFALWRLLREARAGTWLRTRLDYLRYGVLGYHAGGERGARQLYGAVERIFSLNDLARARSDNTREYLAQLCALHGDLRPELGELTRLFEDARYGREQPDAARLETMRGLYRRIYRMAW